MEEPLKPNPGSPEAIKAGCKCPVIDNGHGRGSGFTDEDGKPLFWTSYECPLHMETSEDEGPLRRT